MNKILRMCTVPFMRGMSLQDNERQALETINSKLTEECGEVVTVETLTDTVLFWTRPVGLRVWYRKAGPQ